MIEIVDQDCQTNAPESALFVTALGEICRGPDCILGSLSLCELDKRLGRPHNDADVEAEWERRYRAELTVDEYDFVKKVFARMDAAPSGRWRVYGERTKLGKEVIVLVTEFLELSADDKFWQALLDVKESTEAHLWIMHESKRCEHSWRVGESGKKIPGSDKYGEGHGEMERQVELSWRVENKTPAEVVKLVKRLEKATQKIWNKAGVGVC